MKTPRKQAPENLLKSKGTRKMKRARKMRSKRVSKHYVQHICKFLYNIHTPSLPKLENHWRHYMCKLGPPGAHPHFLTWEVVFTITIGVRAEQAHLIMEACGKAPTRQRVLLISRGQCKKHIGQTQESGSWFKYQGRHFEIPLDIWFKSPGGQQSLSVADKLNFCNELFFSFFYDLLSASLFYFGGTQKSRMHLHLQVNNSSGGTCPGPY